MNKENELKIIEDMQVVVTQMKIDDIEDNPASEFEMFECSACGEEKPYAGSIFYGDYTLCNECALYAETAIALGRIESIHDLVDAMEDKRLEDLCDFIRKDQAKLNN